MADDNLTGPRTKLVLGGKTLACYNTMVQLSGYYHAAKFSASLPIWGYNGLTLNDWLEYGTSGTDTPVQIFGGNADVDGNVTWQTTPLFDGVFTGKKAVIRSDGSNAIDISGVDRTQLLINYKLKQVFPNQTGAETITTLAGLVGMTAQISGASKLVGTLYSKAHVKLLQGDMSKVSNAWDMICYIARMSGNVAFVRGNTVYVQPNNPNTAQAWNVYYSEPTVQDNIVYWGSSSNVSTFEIEHNLLARDITVEVDYFHSKKGKPGRAIVGVNRNRTTVNQSNYVFGPYPNLSEDQAYAYANRLLTDMSIHEYTLVLTAPPDYTLTPYQTVNVQGATGQLAQPFWINEIVYKTDVHDKAFMTVTAKNHPPQNDTSA